MSSPVRTILVLAFLLTSTGLALAADPPDLVLDLGQKATGRISFPGEEDRFRFDAVEGTKITATAKIAKGSPLAPAITVIDPDGNAVNVAAFVKVTSKSAALKKFVTTAPGTWTLVVSGSGGTTGDYGLKTKGAAPKKLPKVVANLTGAGDVKTYRFFVLAGTLVTAKLAGVSKYEPRFGKLYDPDGAEVTIPALLRKTKGSKDTLKKVPLPATGEYVLEVTTAVATPGDYKLAISFKAAKPPKVTHDFTAGSGGEDLGAPVSLRIHAADFAPAVGETRDLIAIGRFADDRERDLTVAAVFTSSRAAVATVTADGTLDAIAAGGSVLRAAVGDLESAGTVLLVGGETIAGVEVAPDTLSLAKGDSAGLTAKVRLTGGGALDGTRFATWKSDNAGRATVDESGVVAAVNGGGVGITAAVGTFVSTSASVTVVAPRLVALRLSPRVSQVAVGGTANFAATGVYSDGSTANVTAGAAWESDWLGAASFAGSTSTGVARGTVGVRARLDGIVSDPALLLVGDVGVASVTVVPSAGTVAEGLTLAFRATASFTDGSSRDVTSAATWSANNGAAARAGTDFEAAGEFTGLAAGESSQVTASLSGASDTANLAVGDPAITAIRIVPADAGLAPGANLDLRAFATRSDGTTAEITSTATWSTSNPGAASVSGGKTTGGTAGATGIAAAKDGITSPVTVVRTGDAAPTGVLIGSTTSSPLGAAADLTAEATFSTGPAVDVTSRARWSSADSAALPVDGGTVVPRALASTDITAAFAGFAASPYGFSGAAAEATGLTIFPGVASAPLGLSFTFAAQLSLTDGGVLDVAPTAAWTSSVGSRATVAGGVMTTLDTGTTSVGASDSGRVASAVVFTIDAPVLVSIELAPATAILEEGATVTLGATGTWSDASMASVSGTATFRSSATGVATVSGAGLVTAVAKGTASITAEQVNALGETIVSPGAAVEVEKAPVVTSLTGIVVLGPGGSTNGLKINGANFLAGSEVSFGDKVDVTVQSITATVITVDIDVDPSATPGSRTVTVTLPGNKSHISGSLVEAFVVKGTAPVVVSVDTATVDRGETADVVVTGDNFDAGTPANMSVNLLRSGVGVGDITLVSLTVTSPTSLTIRITPSAAAVLGDLDLSVHHAVNGTSNVLSDAFAITQPAPTVTTLSPSQGTQGAANLSITVNGTNFLSGDTVAFSGTGVTVDSVTFVSSVKLTVVVDVSAAAATGARHLTVTHPAAAGGKSVMKSGAFTVTAPPPTITGISPGNVDQNVTKTVTITGTYLDDGTISISPSTGLTITGASFSGTSASFSLAVAAGATIGKRDVTITRTDGASATLTDGIKIGPADPEVTDVTPSSVYPGMVKVRFTVSGESFESGNTSVSFSGTDVTVDASSISVTGTTSLSFEADIKSGATIGGVDLTVTVTGKGSGTGTDAVIIAPADPVVLEADVTAIAQGASGVGVTVSGSNFRSGDSLSASGSGLTFTNVSVVNGGTITATLAASGTATKGLSDLTVTHAASEGGGSDTLEDAFEVVGASPSFTSITPAKLGVTGSGGATRTFPVTIKGSDFMTGAALTVTKSGASGVTVVSGSVTVTDTSTLTATLSVTGGATATTWDVKVTNPQSLGDSGTGGNGALTTVSSSSLAVNGVKPALGDSHGGNRVTIYGSGFASGAVVDFGAVRGYGAQVIDASTLVVTVPEPATTSATAATYVDAKVTNPSGSPSTATLTGGYGYERDETTFRVKSTVPVQDATGIANNLKACVFVLTEPAKGSTVTSGRIGWFESGSFTVSGLSVGLGPNQRFVVLKTTATTLPTNNAGTYVMEIQTGVTDRSGSALVPERLAFTGTRDQYTWTIGTGGDTTAPTVSFSPSGSSVATTAAFTATFSEAVDPTTITTSTVTLKQGTTAVAVHLALSDDLKTVTVTPETELGAGLGHTLAVTSGVKDLSGNSVTGTLSQSITTGSGSDTTAPVIDAVILEDLPASMDGSGTYKTGASTSAAYDVYVPQYGFRFVVSYSDEGGAGIDETSLTVTSSVAVGGTSAGGALGGNFSATAAGAEWRIPVTAKVTAGNNVEFKFRIKDTAGNQSAEVKVVVDVVDATGNSSNGGDLYPMESRVTWVLRFDRDIYTVTIGYSGGNVTATTSASSDGTPDFLQALQMVGMQGSETGTNAKTVTNGNSVGANAIAARLTMEAIRERMRERFSIDAAGTRGEDAVNIEFLLPGEQGSLSSLPTYSTSDSSNSLKGFSEMEIGGDTAPNSNPTSSFSTIGRANYDPRNRRDEANLNAGGAGANLGIFLVNMIKGNVNLSQYSNYRGVYDPFIAGRGGTPIGNGADDATVLSDTFDRTSGSNTTAQNARYDAIMDVIDKMALAVSGVTAHEIGHSLGLVPDGAPPTGLFGNADDSNSFTEGGNTAHHLDYLGNDIMSPAASFTSRTRTGTDFQRFNPYDINYLRNRQVYDEAK